MLRLAARGVTLAAFSAPSLWPIKQPKKHIVWDDFEWRALVKGINEYRKQVIDEDGCVEVVNELLIKIIDAPTKKIKVMEVSK